MIGWTYEKSKRWTELVFEAEGHSEREIASMMTAEVG